MKFIDAYIGIQDENSKSIILIRNGIFLVALDKSALALNEIFALKPICFKKGVCKCVIPVSQMKKYMDALVYLDFNFKIYNYDKTKVGDERVKMLFEYSGEASLEDLDLKQDCGNCWYKDRRTAQLNDNFEEEFQMFIEEARYGERK